MPFDLLLYAAFAGGWVLGRLVPHRSPWVGRATLGCVAVLLALLGASFRDVGLSEMVVVVPYAAAFALAVLAVTALLARALSSKVSRRDAAPPTPRAERVPTSVVFLAALLGGAVLGRSVSLPTGELIPWALYALLALVAFGLDLRWAPLKRAWVPVVAASLGAVLTASVFALLTPLGVAPVFASALAFGWYSLAGPLVAARVGATLGLFAFLTNFLRESLTILLAPRLGPSLRGEGLASLGGATSMDTTLYFVVRYGESDAGSLALASGLVLTAAASLVVPLVLSL